MNEDAYSLIVEDGIDLIYRRYNEGKIDREEAYEELAEFLVSKGEPNAFFSAGVTTNQWSR